MHPINTMHHSQSSYLTDHQGNLITDHQGNLISHPSNLMLDSVLRQHYAATTNRYQQQRDPFRHYHVPLYSSGASSTPVSYGRQLPNDYEKIDSLRRSIAWKNVKQRARQYIYQYRTIVNWLFLIILLILLALSLTSIIKFTLSSALNTSTPPPPPSWSSANSSSLASSSSSQYGRVIHLNYPKLDLGPALPARPQDDGEPAPDRHQDVLRSKLLFGEFLLQGHNYTHSAGHKAALADRLVKLMDQVFLASEVRRVYSRTEVTGMRPNNRQPPEEPGVLVECSIILAESIAYAAQQFGIALYDSLARSHGRLAGQPGYVIDKNSIRFNTVPDNDLKLAILPSGFLSPAISRELSFTPDPVAPSGASDRTTDQLGAELDTRRRAQPPAQLADDQLSQLNLVVWSEWSQWSSCVDKNGICDSSRLHSRLRKCVAQHTGEKVDATHCKHRFNPQDLELQVEDCSRSCGQPAESHVVMSDAPSVVAPQTAPSVLVSNEPAAYLPTLLGSGAAKLVPKMSAITSLKDPLQVPPASATGQLSFELYTPFSSSVSAPAATVASVATSTSRERAQNASPNNEIPLSSTPSLAGIFGQEASGSQMSCSNCTSDEICLLLIQQKVPFCAKLKDPTDESGCGGWCKANSQLCQPVGQNAFKCIHDSECLEHEWRCQDSACIPASKRCDGHSNCYDSSDERDCPII